MKRSVLVAMITVALVTGLAAQANLSKRTSLPKVDGAIAASEYQYEGTSGGMKIYATLGSDDMLYLAVEAPTAGYAAGRRRRPRDERLEALLRRGPGRQARFPGKARQGAFLHRCEGPRSEELVG